MSERDMALSLICRVQASLYALPLQHVVETMRPLPIEAIPGSPHFVRGLAVIRGAPVPVVDLARLLGVRDTPADRFVTITLGGRLIALAVGSVLGVRTVPSHAVHQWPPLLHEAGADVISAIGLLDAELLLVLNGTRLLSGELVAGLPVQGAS